MMTWKMAERWRAMTQKQAGRLQARDKKETDSEDCIEKIQQNLIVELNQFTLAFQCDDDGT
jgi:hypothetical protein